MGPTYNLLTAALMVAQQQQMVVVPASAVPAQQPPAQMQVIPNAQVQTIPGSQLQLVPGGQAQMVPGQQIIPSAPQQPGAPCACAANKGQMIIQETQAPPQTSGRGSLFSRVFGTRSAQPTQAMQPVIAERPRDERPVLSGLRRLFGNSPSASAKREPVMTQEPMMMQQHPVPATTTSYPRKMPAGEIMTIPPAQMAPASGPQSNLAPISHTEPLVAYQVNQKLAGKIGRDDDYGWVTGQLQANADGSYVIHYAPEGTIDKYQGRLSLHTTGVDMRRFRDGDLVSVHGGLVSQPGYATVYRANGIDLIERP